MTSGVTTCCRNVDYSLLVAKTLTIIDALWVNKSSAAMEAGNDCALLVLALGCCIPMSLQSSTAPTTVPFPTQLQVSSPTPSLNASTVDCAVDYYTCTSTYNRGVCHCDEQLCTQFGDCCAETQYTHNTTGPAFACVSASVLEKERDASTITYFMIASCPESEPESEIVNGVGSLCEAQSLSSPPISDNRTGFVYRNKYCAQCHGVPDAEQMSWRSQWRCNNTLNETFNEGNLAIDAGLLLSFCNVSSFVQPSSANSLPTLPRSCDATVTYTCRPPPGADTSTAEYKALSDLCRSQLVNVRIIESSNTTLYKNEYCARCSTFGQGLEILCPIQPRPSLGPGDKFGENTFAILLDVTGSGEVVIASEDIVVTSTVEQSCGEGQVFDIYSNICRETLCLPGYTYNGTSCSLLSLNCSVIALNATEYEPIDHQIVFWIALEQNVSVLGYNSEGSPIVCSNFTSNFTTTVNETITRIVYGYPAAFDILSYLGLSVDVVAAAIVFFTYTAFAEMRTFYGKLFINFVVVLLLGDLTFLLGTAVYSVSLEDVVCQVVAILLHYLFLARFAWMSLLSLNVARHFYHAMKFVVSEERESWHYLILYMAAGWLSPLLVLIVTVPVDYAIPGSVGYGMDGLCWMDETLSIIITFIIPLAICILFSSVALAFVCIVLVKLHRPQENTELRHRTNSRNCRVLVAIFGITGATWVFGFLAQIDSSLSWAWYLFIIFSTTQAVFLMLAYVCTAKVLCLYRGALGKCFRILCRRKTQRVPGRQMHDQVELNVCVSINATVTICSPFPNVNTTGQMPCEQTS